MAYAPAKRVTNRVDCVGIQGSAFRAKRLIYQANGSNAKSMAPTCAESSESASTAFGPGDEGSGLRVNTPAANFSGAGFKDRVLY